MQNSIGYIASLGERVKNLFNFTVPYLSYLAMFLVAIVVAVLYLIPIRYLILGWGVNKFSRKIFRPHSVPNNEVLDLLSRVPDDEELINFRFVVDLCRVCFSIFTCTGFFFPSTLFAFLAFRQFSRSIVVTHASLFNFVFARNQYYVFEMVIDNSEEDRKTRVRRRRLDK